MAPIHKYTVSACSPELYPTIIVFGLLKWNADDGVEIPPKMPFINGWGASDSVAAMENGSHPVPCVLDMIWLSITEQKFYSIWQKLDYKRIDNCLKTTDEKDNLVYDSLILGLAPGGGVALWAHGTLKATLLGWWRAENAEVDMSMVSPLNPSLTLRELTDFYLQEYPQVRNNLIRAGIPDFEIYNRLMTQYSFRLTPLFYKWNEESQEWVEDNVGKNIEVLGLHSHSVDGTFHKLSDEYLQNQHTSGLIDKVNLFLLRDKHEYEISLWLNSDSLASLIENMQRFVGRGCFDILTYIDLDNKKIGLSIFFASKGIPMHVNEDDFQYIIFKDDMEIKRSDNYSQRSGAWIW